MSAVALTVMALSPLHATADAATNPSDTITLRIDAGGPGGDGWESDLPSAVSQQSNAAHVGVDQVATIDDPVDISDPSIPSGTPMAIFQTLRADWYSALPDAKWLLPAEPGTHTVRIHFVELQDDFVGDRSRILDIVIDGTVVDGDLDVAGRAGGVRRGFTRSYTVQSSGPAISVNLGRVRRPAAIAGIEIISNRPEPVERRGAWEVVAENTPGIGESGFARVGHRFYQAGGQIGHGFRDVESVADHSMFDPATGTWTAITPLPAPVDHIQPVVVDGRIWYVGGMHKARGVPGLPDGGVHAYDPETDSFEAFTPMPRPRGAGAVAAIGHHLYFLGGFSTAHTATPMVDRYDIDTDTWVSLADMPRPRDHFEAFGHEGRIHVVGGRDSDPGAVLAEHDVYDIGTNTWVAEGAAPIPTPRGGGGLAEIDGVFVYAGGELRRPDAALVTTEGYDPVTDSWERLGDLQVARHGADAAECNGVMWLTGGVGNFGAAYAKPVLSTFSFDAHRPCEPPPDQPGPDPEPTPILPPELVPGGLIPDGLIPGDAIPDGVGAARSASRSIPNPSP